MQLEITKFNAPEPIEFNFEELKSWIQEGVDRYSNIAYTAEDLKQAKADRADLNRIKKALNDRRIQIEKEYMAPFSEFKDRINEIIKMIDEPVQLIDQSVKEFERQKKEEKREQIKALFDGMQKPEWLTLEQIWNEKWLNASSSMKSITKEISDTIERIEADLKSLDELEFAFEAKEHYKKTLNVGLAIQEGVRIAEMMKRKAEEEARRKAEEEARKEAERQAKLDSILHSPTSQIINAAEAREEAERQGIVTDEPYWQPGEPAEVVKDAQQLEFPVWVRFEALLTTAQAIGLKNYCKQAGIRIEPIQ